MNEEKIFWFVVKIIIFLIFFGGLPRILWELFKKLLWLVMVFAVLYFISAFFLTP